jgi:hypothetical protein
MAPAGRATSRPAWPRGATPLLVAVVPLPLLVYIGPPPYWSSPGPTPVGRGRPAWPHYHGLDGKAATSVAAPAGPAAWPPLVLGEYERREKKMRLVFSFMVVKYGWLERFSHIPPIWWNQLIPHIVGIFLFVELIGSVPFHNRTLKLSLGQKQFHYIHPCSRTEHTLN